MNNGSGENVHVRMNWQQLVWKKCSLIFPLLKYFMQNRVGKNIFMCALSQRFFLE